MMINIPMKEQLDKSKQELIKESFDLKEDELDAEKPNRILNEFSKENNIDFIDLYGFFMEKEEPLNYYLKIDNHWNKEGHQLAADVIYESFMNELD